MRFAHHRVEKDWLIPFIIIFFFPPVKISRKLFRYYYYFFFMLKFWYTEPRIFFTFQTERAHDVKNSDEKHRYGRNS